MFPALGVEPATLAVPGEDGESEDSGGAEDAKDAESTEGAGGAESADSMSAKRETTSEDAREETKSA